MPLSPPADVYSRMVSRLPQQYKNAPRMLAVLRSFATPIQEFANNQYKVYQNSQLQRGPAQIIGTAVFRSDDVATAYWPLPMRDGYFVLPGKPVVTDGGGPVVCNVDESTKTATSIGMFASSPFTGYCNILAWNEDELDPLDRGIGGDLLDKIGKIVGEPRGGKTDSEYWVLVTAKIASNRSDGRRETLIRIARLLVPGASIYVKDFPPCAVYVAPQAPIQIDPYVAASFIMRAKAGGVNVAFVWTSVPLANTFCGGSIHAAAFSAGPTVTGSGVTAGQNPGSIHSSGFAAGPAVSGTGGAIAAGVIQSQ